MPDGMLNTVNDLGPNAIYLILMMGMWLAITGIYTPGSGFIEFSALSALALGAVGLMAMDGQIPGLTLLLVSLLCFAALVFYRRYWQLVAVGGVLQLVGSFFLFPADSRPSIVLIVLTSVVTLAYHELILHQGLKSLNRPVWLDDETLVGKEAVVTRALDPQGMIRVEGELWRAVVAGQEIVEPGAIVIVQARKGLVLEVAPPVSEIDKAA